MDCEMCGKTNAGAIAVIEGVQMSVCASCATHGKVLKPLVPTAKERPRPVLRETAREELIESVHPDVAKLLRQHRQRMDLTQEEFAKRMNLRASVYQHYETGKTAPDIATARKLEHELKVPLVVKIKVQGEVHQSHDAQGLTLGDFIKKRR